MLYKLTQYVRCILANTMCRTHHLCWDDWEMGAVIPCMHVIIPCSYHGTKLWIHMWVIFNEVGS